MIQIIKNFNGLQRFYSKYLQIIKITNNQNNHWTFNTNIFTNTSNTHQLQIITNDHSTNNSKIPKSHHNTEIQETKNKQESQS